MTKLFISHATEDKDSFVCPLAEKLKTEFDVWYDDYSLKLGDSLRAKIDEGLRSADYGVVVLSKAFFGKQWPQSELNGLFSLETKNRKIILPVWLDVNKTEVQGYSPMLADRKASLAADGIERVVQDIRMAVSTSARTQEVNNPDSTAIALNRMWRSITGWDLDQRILNSPQGVALLGTAFEIIINDAYNYFLNSTSLEVGKLFKKQGGLPSAYIYGPHESSLGLRALNFAVNTTQYTELEATFYRISGSMYQAQSEELQRIKWALTCFDEKTMGFKSRPDSPAISAEEVSKIIVERFCHFIEIRIQEKDAGRTLQR